MKKRKIRRALILLVITIGVLGYGVGNYFYNLALNPNTDKSSVLNAEHNLIEYEDKEVEARIEKEKQEAEVWYDSSDKESININSYDNLKLSGVKIKNEKNSNRWIIVCHGYTGSGEDTKVSSKKFYDLGFNILVPDARGHGDSQGDFIGMGWIDRLDILNWIEKIISIDKDSEIALYGTSMGGATVMMVSGEELPSNVKVIVEDCGYSSVWDEFSYQLNEIFNLPSFPIMNFSSLVTKIKTGYWLGEGDTLKQLSKNKTPILFIHGDKDTFVPIEMLDKVYQATESPKEKLIIEGAGHGQAANIGGNIYWDKVEEFIFTYID